MTSSGGSLGLRQFGRDTRSTLVRQVTAMVIGLALTVVLARALGPHGNGLYALAILVPTLLATFLNLGLSSANVYYLGTGQVTEAVARRASIAVCAGASVVGVAVVAALNLTPADQWFGSLTPVQLGLALACFPPLLLLQFLTSLLQAQGRFRLFNRTLLTGPVFTFAVVALLAMSAGLSVSLAVAAYGLGLLASLVAGWRSPPRSGGDQTVRPTLASERAYLRTAFGYGWKAQLSNSLTLLIYRIDLLFVAHYLSPASTGIYAVATQIAERLWMPSQAVSTVLLPRLAQLHDDEAVRSQLTPLVTRWTLAISAVGAAVLALVASPLIGPVFGAGFKPLVVPLLLMLPGIVFAAGARVLANDLAARGRPDLTLYATAAALLVNVALNIVLVPSRGLGGAAVAASLTYAADLVMIAWIYARLSETSALHTLIVRRVDLSLLTGLRTRRDNSRPPTP